MVNYYFIIGSNSGKENNPIIIDEINTQSIDKIFYLLIILYNVIKIKK